jgi:hypothetical protein
MSRALSRSFAGVPDHLAALISTHPTMTENAVPPSAPTGETTRGIPYYEKLKRDLRDTLMKKRQLDKNMVIFIPSRINLALLIPLSSSELVLLLIDSV